MLFPNCRFLSDLRFFSGLRLQLQTIGKGSGFLFKFKFFCTGPYIHTLVRPALVSRFKQPLQMNDFVTFDMLPFIPLHFLCTNFWQLVHCNELLPTPLLHTLHGHLTAFCLTFCRSPLIITLVLCIVTLMPLLSTLSFHSLSLLISCSSVSMVGQPWISICS